MSIDPKDLVKIIKACRASGVSELRLAGLELKFGTGEAAGLGVTPGDAVKPPTDKELKEVEEHLLEKSILDTADDELALMQVENPALFEELLVQRELERREGSTEEATLD